MCFPRNNDTALKSLEEHFKLLADGGRKQMEVQRLASAEETMRASMADLTGIRVVLTGVEAISFSAICLPHA